MGLGAETQDKYKAVPVFNKKLESRFVEYVSVGEGHVFAVTNDTTTLSWGDGLQGSLGNGDWRVQHDPVPVSIPDSNSRFKTVICGSNHTIAL